MCASTFLGEGTDVEDNCKADIIKMLRREVIKNRDMRQQLITEGPVYEFDKVYDKTEERRKKAVAAKLDADKVKPKYITMQKKAAEQR